MAQTINPQEQLLTQYVDAHGHDAALRFFAEKAGYLEVPPDITTFMTDREYCGNFLGGTQVWPTWREELPFIFPNPVTSPYNEIILTGSIGSGKSTCALIGMLYDLAKILHLARPQEMFGLIPTSNIVIAFINATVSLSDSVLYPQFIRWIYNSPFFQREMSRVGLLDFKSRKKLVLPHGIEFISGSRARHALGQNVVMAILSELNFQSAIVKTQAAQNYEQLKNRMRSRYGLVTKIAPGRLWLDSSKSDETGYQEKLIQEAEEHNIVEINEGKHPSSRIICKSFWETKGRAYPWMFPSGKTFKVFVGNSHIDAFIPEAPGDYLGLPDDCIVDVPLELKYDFERNLLSAIRDLAGVSTWGSFRFMSQEALVRKSLCLENAVKYKQQVIRISFEDDEDQLINYVDIEKLKQGLTLDDGRIAPAFLHYDLSGGKVESGGDRSGIAISCSLGEVSVERTQSVLLENPMTRDLLLRTPLVMCIAARPGKEIPLSKMRNFFIHLMRAGIKVVGVSADQWQSKELLQSAKKAGMLAEQISVDTTKDAYEYLRDAINEQRWQGPIHEILLRELLNLRDEGKKVNHPLGSGTATAETPSKDIADAVAGSVYWCHLNSGLLTAAGAYKSYAQKKRGELIRPETEIDQVRKQTKDMMQDVRLHGQRRKGF